MAHECSCDNSQLYFLCCFASQIIGVLECIYDAFHLVRFLPQFCSNNLRSTVEIKWENEWQKFQKYRTIDRRRKILMIKICAWVKLKWNLRAKLYLLSSGVCDPSYSFALANTRQQSAFAAAHTHNSNSIHLDLSGFPVRVWWRVAACSKKDTLSRKSYSRNHFAFGRIPLMHSHSRYYYH